MEIKIRKYCNIEQPASRFERANVVNGKVYCRLKCSACKRKNKADRKKVTRLWLEQYKKSRCCERCGFSDHRALEFHHLRQEDKSYHISEMPHGHSIKTIAGEMLKCILLCANCHAIEHYCESTD